jgi:hypothetical protein
MRPRGTPSKWVKILPWYYSKRRQPSRAAEKTAAIKFERKANASAHPAG